MIERAPIAYDFKNGIATITIDNFKPVKFTPNLQQINTLDKELFEEINLKLNEIQDFNIDTIVFTGIGKKENYYPVFCDGIDLRKLAELKMNDFDKDMKTEITIRKTGIDVLNRLAQMPHLVIARINGFCIGGGLEFALGCDYLIALPNMLIGLPEIKYGILPGWNGLQSLAHKIGKEKALNLFFEGFFEPSGKNYLRNGLIFSEEGAELGILDQIVPNEKALDEAILIRAFEAKSQSTENYKKSHPLLSVYKVLE